MENSKVEPMNVQIQHLSDAVRGLTGKVDLLIDMTKTIAVMKAEADNHWNYTQQMEVRMTHLLTKLEGEVKAAEDNRVMSSKKIHARVDHLYRWMYTVAGGAAVILGLLAYAAEGVKSFAEKTIVTHDMLQNINNEVDKLHAFFAGLERRTSKLEDSSAVKPSSTGKFGGPP